MNVKKDSGMKSALEIAMEKIDGKGRKPVKLSENQKREIEEIEMTSRAAVAEIEIMMAQRLAQAREAGDVEAAAKVNEEKASEISRILRNAEAKKEKVRDRGEASP